jgi:hypothetical protein
MDRRLLLSRAMAPRVPAPGRWLSIASIAVGALLGISTAGCGSSSSAAAPAEGPRVFVGQVTGTDARVGIIATAHHARVYFCGGDGSYGTLTHWIPSATLDPAGGGLSQAADAAGWAIDGHLDASGASGTLMAAGGAPLAFSALPVAPGTIAGLYETLLPCGKVGVIVAQASASEDAVGQGACIASDGSSKIEQVNPIRPIVRGTDGAIPVAVDGAMTTVRPAAAPAE